MSVHPVSLRVSEWVCVSSPTGKKKGDWSLFENSNQPIALVGCDRKENRKGQRTELGTSELKKDLLFWKEVLNISPANVSGGMRRRAVRSEEMGKTERRKVKGKKRVMSASVDWIREEGSLTQEAEKIPTTATQTWPLIQHMADCVLCSHQGQRLRQRRSSYAMLCVSVHACVCMNWARAKLLFCQPLIVAPLFILVALSLAVWKETVTPNSVTQLWFTSTGKKKNSSRSKKKEKKEVLVWEILTVTGFLAQHWNA